MEFEEVLHTENRNWVEIPLKIEVLDRGYNLKGTFYLGISYLASRDAGKTEEEQKLTASIPYCLEEFKVYTFVAFIPPLVGLLILPIFRWRRRFKAKS
jgi:hypothetical protein